MSKEPRKTPIKIYIDTCVLLDFLIKERKNEISNYILRTIDGKRYLGIISRFSLLELKDNLYAYTDMINKIKEGTTPYEIIQSKNERIITTLERKKDDDEISNFLERNKRKIQLSVQGDNSIWERSMELMEFDNFSAPDALHVASAILNKCHYFLTKDTQLILCLQNDNITQKILVIEYNKSTHIEDFIARFNNLEAEYEDLKLGDEEKKAKNFFKDIISLIQPKSFDPDEYEKKAISKKRKK